MRDACREALAHNGEEAFDHHLVGVQSVLRSWQAPKHLCDAALFHSVYGTEGFQGFKLPLSHRAELVELIGADAEKLAWIFCMVDRASVDETVFDAVQYVDGRANASLPMFAPRFRARVELGAFQISLTSTAEWLDFITLSLADWLEQVEGAARAENPPVLWGKGEAWAYRRDGYAAMAALLAEHGPTQAIREAAPRMHAEVYGREPEATRDLVQPVTPPVSAAAREAYEAIASAQLDGSAVGTPRVPTTLRRRGGEQRIMSRVSGNRVGMTPRDRELHSRTSRYTTALAMLPPRRRSHLPRRRPRQRFDRAVLDEGTVTEARRRVDARSWSGARRIAVRAVAGIPAAFPFLGTARGGAVAEEGRHPALHVSCRDSPRVNE